MEGVTLTWAWPNHGGRWHLLADDADLALCGVGKRGWELRGGGFDRDYRFAHACLPCLAAERKRAATPSPAAGTGASDVIHALRTALYGALVPKRDGSRHHRSCLNRTVNASPTECSRACDYAHGALLLAEDVADEQASFLEAV